MKKNKKKKTASEAAAKEIGVDIAVIAVLSEQDGIFRLKEEQRMSL